MVLTVEIKEVRDRLQARLDWIEKQKANLEKKEKEIQKQLDLVLNMEAIELQLEFDEWTEEVRMSIGPYSDMTQEEALIHALHKSDEPLNAAAITEKLQEGGYLFRTANPANSIYALVNKLEKAEKLNKEKTDEGVCFSLREDKK